MIAGSLFPIYFIDSPDILYANITPIPASSGSPLQVVANSGTRAAYGVSWIDTTGDYIGLYTGVSGHEVLRAIIGGGVTSAAPVVIAAGSRVSLRSMTNTAITNGQLVITFLGQGLP
jgi:predicted DNA repair protein MutK